MNAGQILQLNKSRVLFWGSFLVCFLILALLLAPFGPFGGFSSSRAFASSFGRHCQPVGGAAGGNGEPQARASTASSDNRAPSAINRLARGRSPFAARRGCATVRFEEFCRPLRE